MEASGEDVLIYKNGIPLADITLRARKSWQAMKKENDTTAQEGISGTQYLLSLAGAFDSGENRTSENENRLVTEAILRKHGRYCKKSLRLIFARARTGRAALIDSREAS